MCICMCMCPSPRLSIINGVIWTPYDWGVGINKLYGFYMATIVGTVSSHGLSIDAHHRNQHNRSELVM